MKKLLFGILALATMYSCDCGSSYSISGKLSPELLGDSIYLLDMDRAVITSAPINNTGEFSIENEIEIPSVAYLAGENMRPFVELFLESGNIDVIADIDGRYAVTGTTSNDKNIEVVAQLQKITDDFEAFGEDVSEATVDSLRTVYRGVITNAVVENMDNIYGVNLFATQEFTNMNLADAKVLMDKFPAELQQTQLLVNLREKVAALEKTEDGQPYIDIKLLDAEGKEIALSSVVGEGKWVLLDFWATWCPPCIKEIPYLLEAYDEFKDRGFNIYGVSLDRNPNAWKSYIVANKMVWPNVINTADSPATEAYAVRSIPTSYLISPDGIIVAKNLKGYALKEKLAELIK